MSMNHGYPQILRDAVANIIITATCSVKRGEAAFYQGGP